jgi:hypothetical protein
LRATGEASHGINHASFFPAELTKRFDMDNRQEIEMLEKAISVEAARTDALAAALEGVLAASRGNPDVAKAVTERLQAEYDLQRSKPHNEHYMLSLETMRAYLQKLVE